MSTFSIMELVRLHGNAGKSEDRFALYEAIEAGIKKLQNQINCDEIELDRLRMQVVNLEFSLRHARAVKAGLTGLGSPAADAEECQHEEGTRTQEFDADGCGYYLWTCNACGYTEHDDMP